MRSRRVGLQSIGLAVLLFSTYIVSTSSGESATEQLVVNIDGLPEAVPGRVQVTGQGHTWELQESTTLQVAPGTYTITIDPVRAGQATSYGADERQRINVSVGERTTVDAGYRVTIPDTTKVVPNPADPPIISVGEDSVELVAGEYADQLRAGDAIVVAEGPKTPAGLCRKVLSVTQQDGVVLAQTAPMSLFDAVPNLVLRFDHARTTVLRSSAAEEPGAGEPSPQGSDKPLLKFGATLLEDKNGPRESKMRAEVTIDKFQLELDGDIDVRLWGNERYVEVGLTPTLLYDSTVHFAATGPLSGNVREDVDLIGLDNPLNKPCQKLVGRLPKIGPVSLGCEIRGILEGEAAVTGGINFSRRVTGDHSLPVSWRTGQWPEARLEGWPPQPDPQGVTVVAAEGSAKGKGGVRLFFGGGLISDKALELALNIFYGLEAKIDTRNLRVESGQFFETTLDLSLDLPSNVLDARVNLFSYDKKIPPVRHTEIELEDLGPPENVVLAFEDSVGIHVLRPATGEVDTVGEWRSGLPNGEIVLSPDGRFLVGQYLPGSSGLPQSLFIWDSATSATKVTSDDFGYGGGGYHRAMMFLDNDTIVGLEAVLYSQGDVSQTQLYFVKLPSGEALRRNVPAPRLTGLIGRGPESGTLLALDEKPRDEFLPEHLAPPTDLVWLDQEGRELRRINLHETKQIGETVLSPDRKRLAAFVHSGVPLLSDLPQRYLDGESRRDLLIVDLLTGKITNAGNYHADSYNMPLLRSLRWVTDTAVLVQAYNTDVPSVAHTSVWQNGKWHLVDTDPHINAMAFGRQIQVVQVDESLYVLYNHPYAEEKTNLYTQPHGTDIPVASGILDVWFPDWDQPSFIFE